MKIGIIGGGLTGLVAAHALSEQHEVDIFEKMPFFGGCLSSYPINDYWIERYYHHCFSTDTHLFALIDKLGLSEKDLMENGHNRLLCKEKDLCPQYTQGDPALPRTFHC